MCALLLSLQNASLWYAGARPVHCMRHQPPLALRLPPAPPLAPMPHAPPAHDTAPRASAACQAAAATGHRTCAAQQRCARAVHRHPSPITRRPCSRPGAGTQRTLHAQRPPHTLAGPPPHPPAATHTHSTRTQHHAVPHPQPTYTVLGRLQDFLPKLQAANQQLEERLQARTPSRRAPRAAWTGRVPPAWAGRSRARTGRRRRAPLERAAHALVTPSPSVPLLTSPDGRRHRRGCGHRKH